jgi:hypothetical protein
MAIDMVTGTIDIFPGLACALSRESCYTTPFPQNLAFNKVSPTPPISFILSKKGKS